MGLNLFIAANIAGGKFATVSRLALPYILAYVAMPVLFIFFPGLLTLFH